VAFDADRPDLTIGIVGAGVMGRGIAQVAAAAGLTVLLADARPEAAHEARSFCSEMLRRKADKGEIETSAWQASLDSIRIAQADASGRYGAFAACDLVIEAVAEQLDVKHAVLAALEESVRETCIIATNTSSLTVTAFAAKARRPERVAGFHFFNPVPVRRLVEVIGGVSTAPWALDALDALARRLGHEPVRARDMPGFLVNHAGRAFGTEALRIVSEGICAFADVDRVMVEAAGFRMGPFELFDLTGLDVSYPVMESIYHQFFEEPRFRPSVIAAQRMAGGLYGRKVGRGFYTYADGVAQKPTEMPAPAVDPGTFAVWVSNRVPEAARPLRRVLADAGARLETGARPSFEALIVTTPFGEDTTTAALAEQLDAGRTVAVDCLLGLDRRRTLMTTPITAPEIRDAAHALLARGGTPVTVIGDSPGFIAQRILASIVNVGSDIAQQRIASPAEIDIAVELGLGYPRGPLRVGNELGPRRVLGILEAMHRFYGDPRYRPSPWLKRRAFLGVPLTLA
jgi:3-hydroxybutyryl-CoA dehydrogenase